jgi:ferredoxin-NADP reductase
MAKIDYRKDIQGYEQLRGEIEILNKYGTDYESHRGSVTRVIDRLHPTRLQLKVSEIKKETGTTKTIRFISSGRRLPPFQAGQYINLFVKIGDVRTSRPYSLSSAPHQTGFYDITVRKVESGFVSSYLLDELQVGDELESTAPAGYFYHNPIFHGKDLVFLAGGSGITPLMSMIREVTDRGLNLNIHLIYGSRNYEDIIYYDEIEERAARHSQFRVTHVISEPPSDYTGCCGFISADLLRDVLGDVSDKTFYLCGPDAMYRFCRQELSNLCIPKKKIRNEMFGPPADITSDQYWPTQINPRTTFKVTVHNGKTFPAVAGETLMASLERAGLSVPSSCRSGECSLCRTKLLSGTVFHPRSVKLRKSDIKYGYIHPCVAYPLEDLLIII